MMFLEHHTVEINGDVTMRTNGQQTSEYGATQSMDSVDMARYKAENDQMCCLCFTSFCVFFLS